MRPGAVVRQRALGPVLGDLMAPGARILDVGGNDGSISSGFGGSAVRRIVLDLDQVGLKAARQRGVAAVMASAIEIPLPCDSIDLVLCCDLLPCVRLEDASRVYKEIARVLKKDGRLILTEVDESYKLPFVDNEVAFARWGANTGGFSRQGLVALLDGADLEVVDHRRFYGVVTRFAYTTFFFWVRPRHGHRFKPRAWRAIVNLERWWCPAPQAHLIVAKARPERPRAGVRP